MYLRQQSDNKATPNETTWHHPSQAPAESLEAAHPERRIEPESVQQASAQETRLSVGVTPGVTQIWRSLSRLQLLAIITKYGSLTTLLLMVAGHQRYEWMPFLCFVLPALLAIILGAFSPCRRAGMASGILLAAASIAAAISSGLGHGGIHFTDQDRQIFTTMIAGGAFLGAAGAEFRRQMQREFQDAMTCTRFH